MKVRVYKTPDGEVVVDTPSKRYQDKIEECPHPGRFRSGEDFEVEVMEMADLEKLVGGDNEAGSAQFYYDGSLKHDDGWEEMVMPETCVLKRHKNKLELELDEELAKDTPDPAVVVKKDRELKKLGSLKTEDVYKLALSKLEKEKKKPKIQAKLKEKLGIKD
jgi:hypothetical protein